MAKCRLEKEQKRLATEMNVPYVESNVYVKSLQSRDISYETRLITFDSQNIKKEPDPKHSKSTKQNSKGARPKVPPRQSTLKHL